MPSRQPSASPPGSQSWLPALPPGFQTPVVEFAREPFARLTYAYPSRRPATVDLGVLPAPMRQEVAYWLHTLAVAGERLNSWALAEWVRVAAAVAAGQDLCSFTGLSVEEWMAAARRRYHDRHRRLPPESYLHNHRATIARLHDALMLACQAGEPWWRSQVWDPRHDRRIPVRRHEPLEGQRLNFARVSPAWLREAIQWYFASGLTTGLLSWSSLPGYLSYLGRHFAGFLATQGLDTPVLAAGSGSYRGQPEGNYIDPAAMSRILAHADILGLSRDQAKTVVVNGTPRQVHGLGDEQAMRAFLLAIATGRRINEILMMDFAPLSAVPGLAASNAEAGGGPVARLRYQQTKIAGAPQAILAGADVAAIVKEQQEFARALVRARDPAAPDPPYLFLAWQANTAGQRNYRANTLNGLLTQLAAALQVTDATGTVADFQRTHRMRHTKATDLLNAGVPLHVVQRYMGHLSPEMTMHYAKTLAETHEREFLRFAKLGRDARPLEMDPADVYELVQLDRHTDRILPNGVCLLPPPKRCDRGNACLTCDHFATDARHLCELRSRLAGTEELIQARQD